MSLFKVQQPGVSYKYEIISHEENFEETGNIYAKIRVCGVSKTFYKSVAELYQKSWLEDFSREDAAFIAILFLAEQQNTPQLIKLFPTKKHRITKNYILLGMLFVAVLILSNLTASKIVAINLDWLNLFHFFSLPELNFPAALVFFPLTYFLDDSLTEVYGFKASRFIIWVGLLCNTLVTLGIFITINLKPSHFWPYQEQYAIALGSTGRILMASTIGYFVGEFCNSIILSKIKVITAGRWLWLRVITSTSVAVGVDSILFCTLAFGGDIPMTVVWQMTAIQYTFKVSYELLALPITYMVTNYLKNKDQVDYYDYKTNFNPFSLNMDE